MRILIYTVYIYNPQPDTVVALLQQNVEATCIGQACGRQRMVKRASNAKCGLRGTNFNCTKQSMDWQISGNHGFYQILNIVIIGFSVFPIVSPVIVSSSQIWELGNLFNSNFSLPNDNRVSSQVLSLVLSHSQGISLHYTTLPRHKEALLCCTNACDWILWLKR